MAPQMNAYVTDATVVGVDPTKRVLFVLTQASQMTGIPVIYPNFGPCDALRTSQKAMPKRGTRGLVVFVHGDSRNGVWLCSFPASFENANGTPTDPDAEYTAHASGGYDLHTGSGEFTKSFADGTFIRVGVNPSKPTLTRSTADQNQAQQNVPFPDSQRVNSAVPPMPMRIESAFGPVVDINAAGVTVTLAAGQTLNITNGGALNDMLVLVSKLLAKFNNHTHSGVATGSGTSSTPTTPLQAADVSSTVVKVSS